jgi:hypothetical protein
MGCMLLSGATVQRSEQAEALRRFFYAEATSMPPWTHGLGAGVNTRIRVSASQKGSTIACPLSALQSHTPKCGPDRGNVRMPVGLRRCGHCAG